MKTNAWVPMALALVLAAGLFLAVKARNDHSVPATTTAAATTEPTTAAPATESSEVVTQTPKIDWQAAATGRVEPKVGEIKIGAAALGRVTAVLVEAGDKVDSGTELAVVEAMKMENILRATLPGKVKKFHAQPGDALSVGQIILEFE